MDQTKYCTGLHIKGLITIEAYFLPLKYHVNIHDWSPENSWTGLSLPLDSQGIFILKIPEHTLDSW